MTRWTLQTEPSKACLLPNTLKCGSHGGVWRGGKERYFVHVFLSVHFRDVYAVGVFHFFYTDVQNKKRMHCF